MIARSIVRKLKWLKIIVMFNAEADLRQGLELCRHLEITCGIKNLYFARYWPPGCVEITCETDRSFSTLRLAVRTAAVIGVKRVRIEELGSGSLAHAHGYQAVKEIMRDPDPRRQLMDVVHWTMNMCSCDYAHEVLNYLEASNHFLRHMIPGDPQPAPKLQDAEAKLKQWRKAVDPENEWHKHITDHLKSHRSVRRKASAPARRRPRGR